MNEFQEYLKTAFGPEWYAILEKEFETPWFLKIAQSVSEEREKKMVYPPSEDVFRAFRETPPSKVKVVHVGQD